MLAACGAEVSLELQPGGHELTPAELQSVQGWTAKELA